MTKQSLRYKAGTLRGLGTLLALGLSLVIACQATGQDVGWPTYGGDAGGQRYSSARQISRENVGRVHRVWEYHTRALQSGRVGSRSASFETTPILFRGLLYLTTPFDEVIALDPANGKERWRYAPPVGPLREGDLTTSRGVAAWDSGRVEECGARIFVATLNGLLASVDAGSGRVCQGFGTGGQVDLKAGLSEVDKDFRLTSAPTVLGDVVVVGSSISDNYAVRQARGTVRAFDVRTGRQLWAWEPLPWALSQKIPTGAGNAWSTIAADPALGLVYVPTGSASPDYYGGMRAGDGRDADSVVALEARTGHRVWGFQVVHHDLWDYDVPSEPLLFLWHGSVPALAATTKMGMVFVLDRRTGVPLLPVEERQVPKSDVAGEAASATQPFSSLPPLAPLTMPWGEFGVDRDASDAAFCRQQVAALRYDGIYTPPSLQGSLVFPGAVGGVSWGSAAYNPESGVLYANTNVLPYSVQLIRQRGWLETNWVWVALGGSFALGVWLGFVRRRSWRPGWGPGLVMVVMAGWMVWYGVFYTGPPMSVEEQMAGAFGNEDSPQLQTPYRLVRHPILDHRGLPCVAGPFGMVAALNLQTGKMAWQVAHGTQSAGKVTGSVSLGGVMVTAGGLVFSAGTKEPVLRAYDSSNGQELWKAELPAPAQATPMTY